MTIYRGPLLMMATQQEQQQRLADAERLRRIRNAERANAADHARRRVRTSSRIYGGRNAVKGWLSALACWRTVLVPSVEK